MKKVVNIVYQPGAGGEFLTWALSQQKPFVPRQIQYEHDINKWTLHENYFDYISDDKINLYRQHLNDYNSVKQFDDWDRAFIVMLSTNERSSKFCKGLHSLKLDGKPGIHEYDHIHIARRFKSISRRNIKFIDPFLFWNLHKESRILFEWLEHRFSITLEHNSFVNLKELWSQRNLDILEERV